MKIEQIKKLQDNLKQISEDSPDIRSKRESYQEENKHLLSSISKNINDTKEIKNVLLTGATGHLGCHILYCLLINTQYNVTLLVRGLNNEDVYQKVYNKFNYYFHQDLSNYEKRIRIFKADIGLYDLAISRESYRDLENTIDSVIHCAASVKFFDDYDNLYQANVIVTRNLLRFTTKTTLKDFHFISTLGIFMDGFIKGVNYYEFTENDSGGLLQSRQHLYCETKFLAEQEVIKSTVYGVKANIYRVGNLVANSLNYTCQENINDNAYFHRLKTYIFLQQIPGELSTVEASPVDFTALAIIKLFDKKCLINQTFHISNPTLYDIANYLKNTINHNAVKLVSMNEFLDTLASHSAFLSNNSNYTLSKFCLLQNWLGQINVDQITKSKILSERTNLILSKLDFDWGEIDQNKIINLLAIDIAYKMVEKDSDNQRVFDSLQLISELIPVPFYWVNSDRRLVGINNVGLKAIGIGSIQDALGMSAFELYGDYAIADRLDKSIAEVIKTGQFQECEDQIIDVSTKKYRYYRAIRKPVFNTTGEIIAIVGVSLEITAQRELEKIQNELSVQLKINEEQKKYRDFLTKLINLIKLEAFEFLPNDNLSLSKNTSKQIESSIEINKLQEIILYFISHGKGFSEISDYLKNNINLELSSQAISSIINSQLYQKFEVDNINDLILKAYKYNLIPLDLLNN